MSKKRRPKKQARPVRVFRIKPRKKARKRAKRRASVKVAASRKPRRRAARHTYHRKHRRRIGGIRSMKKNAILDALMDTAAATVGMLAADIGAGQLTQRGILDAKVAAGAAGVVGLGAAVMTKGAMRQVGIGMATGAAAGFIRSQLPDGWVSGLSESDREFIERMAVNGVPTVAGVNTIAGDDLYP